MSLDLEVEEYDANNHKQQNVDNEQQKSDTADGIISESNEQSFQYYDSDIAVDAENEGNNKRNHKHNELSDAECPVEFVRDSLADESNDIANTINEANFDIKDPVSLVDECNDHFDVVNDDLEIDLSNEEFEMIMNGHDQENEFKEKVGLKRHIWTIHKSGMSEDSKQFKCKLCALTFSQAKYVIEHVKSVHKSRNDFKCDTH